MSRVRRLPSLPAPRGAGAPGRLDAHRGRRTRPYRPSGRTAGRRRVRGRPGTGAVRALRATAAVPRVAPRQLRAVQGRPLRAGQRRRGERRGDRGARARRELPRPPQLSRRGGRAAAHGRARRGRGPSGDRALDRRDRRGGGDGQPRARHLHGGPGAGRRRHAVQRASGEARGLAHAATLFKALPVTPVMLSPRYLAENGTTLRELADKIVGEQQDKHDDGYYFYNPDAAAAYSRWAAANLLP